MWSAGEYKLKDPSICPKCGGPMRDLRGVGFNPAAIALEGTCFLWKSGHETFTCVARQKGEGARRLPQDVSLSEACQAVGIEAASWPELHAKAKAAGIVLVPGPRKNIIDLCRERLCMEPATHEVTVSNEQTSVTIKLCPRHKADIVDKATEAGGIDVKVTCLSEVA